MLVSLFICFFLTTFPIGLNSETQNNKLILKANFDQFYSNKFCGSKAVEYFTSLNIPSLLLVIQFDSVQSSLPLYEPLFRKLLHSELQKYINDQVAPDAIFQKQKITIVVNTLEEEEPSVITEKKNKELEDENTPEESVNVKASIQASLQSAIESIWSELTSTVRFLFPFLLLLL